MIIKPRQVYYIIIFCLTSLFYKRQWDIRKRSRPTVPQGNQKFPLKKKHPWFDLTVKLFYIDKLILSLVLPYCLIFLAQKLISGV